MSGMSVATIKSPEFINITSINPLISKCEIKVMYLGQNRNRSCINKEVAMEMAQTLPGTPIVGYYSESKEDFMDHGEQVTIDAEGVKFKCLTKPYGFVDINTKVWFKEFEDTDDFGHKEIRTYLMCEGYLWTEQYEEAKKVIDEGRPHSMELDEKTLKGHWSEDTSRGIEFFIVNDAIFSKLCILGEETEPCFEGSSVTAPDVSSNFSLEDNDFSKTLFSMIQQLKEFTLNSNTQGGNTMSAENQTPVVENGGDTSTNFSNEQDKNVQGTSPEINSTTGEFTKKEEEKKEEPKKEEKKEEGSKDNPSEDKDTEKKEDKKDTKEEDEKKEKPSKNTLEEKYALLEAQLTELTEKYSALEQKNEELLSFKLEAENKEKDALIAQFFMLSDEDKKDVIENKAKYSLDDIEAKLSVICVRKKVNFDNGGSDAGEQNPATTFNLNSLQNDGNSDLPAWLQQVEKHRQQQAN